MKPRSRLLLTAALVGYFCAMLANAQTTPNLSGSWKLNENEYSRPRRTDGHPY